MTPLQGLHKVRAGMRRIRMASVYARKSYERYFHPSHAGDPLARLWLANDQSVFEAGRAANQNAAGSRNIMLRWLNTLWCNNRCPYCDQPHARAKKGHAFDMYPVETWLACFDRHFKERNCNLLLVITGGEPMLDIKNMKVFLAEMGRRPYVLNMRIDTNLSWPLNAYDSIDKKKVWLMCTLHPTQMDEEVFFTKVIQAQDSGYNIGMCNYVITPDSYSRYQTIAEKLLRHDIPLHPNPLWDTKGVYDDQALYLLKKYLPEKDFIYRAGCRKTFGRACLFPAVGYEMDMRGTVRVGCHYSAMFEGNFVRSRKLPKLFDGGTACTQEYCKCLDKYSFLVGFNRNYELNPLYSYKKQLTAILRQYAGMQGRPGKQA